MNKMSMYKSLQISCLLVLSLFLFNSCSDDSVSTNISSADGPIFSQISAAQSGIDFINEIIETPTRSMGNYENFFSGAGVAVGDIYGRCQQ